MANHNPKAAARAAFEEFHGTPATGAVVVEEELHYHEHLADVGELVKLEVLPAGDDSEGVVLEGFDGAWLAMNEEKTDLFVVGGDQSVDCGVFGLVPPYKETEVLGEVEFIEYFTTKEHLGDEGGTANFRHQFGEDGGELPVLLYKTIDRRLEFAGGDYGIIAEGIED